ncbi:MAG: hypothetical protein WCR42_01460 [bacterium]
MKNFKMLILLAAVVVAISACNTENPITSNNEGNDPNSLFQVTWNPNAVGDCDYYNRSAERGGPHGYSLVLSDRSIFGTIIICRDAGQKYCPREIIGVSPANGIPTSDMLNASNYAYAQIVSGNLTGNIVFESTGLTVKWSSTSPDTTFATSNVKVWETMGTEPN